MEIKETLDKLNQEIANTILKLGAKSREQAGMLSKLEDISEEIVYLSAILKQYEEDRKRYEMMKRVADSERKITDLDCIMLKMGARIT
ncbi:hypothetical protein BELINDA_214 [Bacillus phage Belinda]|uniref:hypothetical protein n=1 Tax=Bacillus phage Belinda TaxID=1852564 RepID=UPI0007F155B6|nr:hypothetical protein BI039_gp164 [Bacillus phage Belinda]ANM46140.1 hypothetical protein BELINDA_214 [Bacillus phage Belinda]